MVSIFSHYIKKTKTKNTKGKKYNRELAVGLFNRDLLHYIDRTGVFFDCHQHEMDRQTPF